MLGSGPKAAARGGLTFAPLPCVPCVPPADPTARLFSTASLAPACRRLLWRASGIPPRFCGSVLMSAWITLERTRPKSKKKSPNKGNVGAQRLSMTVLVRQSWYDSLGATILRQHWELRTSQCGTTIVKPVRQPGSPPTVDGDRGACRLRHHLRHIRRQVLASVGIVKKRPTAISYRIKEAAN
jgi:hypothetical protein